MTIYITFFLCFLSGTFCIIDRDFYNDLKENAAFKLLNYQKIVEIFKDYNPGDPKLNHRNRMEDEKIILAKLKEKTEGEPFMALEKEKIVLPQEFDWRKEMPKCFKPPLAQRHCGSCYLFSSVSAFEQRLCIHSEGKIKPQLSQQDALSCDTNHDKCNGGRLIETWEFMEKTGICSYHCKPYVSFDGSVPKCSDKCDNPSYNYIKWQTRKDSMILIINDIQKIKEEIFKNGPVTTAMDTWDDLEAYESGLYFHVKGENVIGHAVSIVGWGYDSTYKDDYWIIRNSWGPDWGEGGYFKVLKGLYRVGEYIVASLPDI